jgi:hypothetical protein
LVASLHSVPFCVYRLTEMSIQVRNNISKYHLMAE